MKNNQKSEGFFARLALMVVSRWLSKRRKSRTAPQLAVLSGDTVGEAIVLNGIYEKWELEALITWLTRVHSGVFQTMALDIGGNIGNHAAYFSRFFNQVVSFEPNPRIFPLLSYNLSKFARADARNLALSDRTGTAYLDVPAGNCGGAHISASAVGDCIQLERLDDQKLEADKVGFIKLDVEGHELMVLEGGRALIARDQPIIVFEQHASEIANGTSPVIDWLKQTGYDQFYCVARPGGFMGKLRPVSIRPIKQLNSRNYPMIIAFTSDCNVEVGEHGE